MEWITELCRELLEITGALILVYVSRMLRDGGVALEAVVRRIFRVYYDHCYYPGSTWMSIWCWLKHPVSEVKRAEAEFSAGWSWPDPDGIEVRIG